MECVPKGVIFFDKGIYPKKEFPKPPKIVKIITKSIRRLKNGNK